MRARVSSDIRVSEMLFDEIGWLQQIGWFDYKGICDPPL